MKHQPSVSSACIYDPHARHMCIDLHAMPGPSIPRPPTGLRARELGLACFGLLRHNSTATWRQLPSPPHPIRRTVTTTETCRPIYWPSAIVHLSPDGIRPDIRVIPAIAVRLSDGVTRVFRTVHRHTGILNNVASRPI